MLFDDLPVARKQGENRSRTKLGTTHARVRVLERQGALWGYWGMGNGTRERIVVTDHVVCRRLVPEHLGAVGNHGILVGVVELHHTGLVACAGVVRAGLDQASSKDRPGASGVHARPHAFPEHSCM